MLKLQPELNFVQESKLKCGEIYCRSFKEFTIFCTFCQMKSFQFNDFILHIQNVHLTKELSVESQEFNNYNTKTPKNSFEKQNIFWDKITQPSLGNLEIDLKNESCIQETDKSLWHTKRWTSSSSSQDDNWEGENLKVLKNPKRKIRLKKNVKQNQAGNEGFQKEQNKSKVESETSNLIKKPKVNEYSCTECNETFLQKKHLDQHVRNLHNGYKCSLCDKRFNRTSHVECHLKTHTTEKKFICPMKNCRRGFIDEDYLKRHLEVHTMERSFVCGYENCGKAFQTQRRLASHEYTHRIPKKFVCDMCGYSCRSNPQLITHQRVHTGEKPFPCEVCRKPFISKMALQEHMISHSETRPHVCLICNKAFANRRVLIRHSYIHSDEKTFKCKVCDSAFKHPNSLQGHMRHIHREPKMKSVLRN